MVGTNDLVVGGIYYRAKKYIKHEKHAAPPSIYSNDFALIQIWGTIDFNDKVQPIEPSLEEIPVGSDTRLSGWGRLKAN